jgi:hypothetical protein
MRISEPLTSGLSSWIESSNTHATKVIRRVRYPTSTPSAASLAMPNRSAWNRASPFRRLSENAKRIDTCCTRTVRGMRTPGSSSTHTMSCQVDVPQGVLDHGREVSGTWATPVATGYLNRTRKRCMCLSSA